jgi:hypothetical protein
MLSSLEDDRAMTRILVLLALIAFLGLHAVVTAVALYPEAPFVDACDGSNC